MAVYTNKAISIMTQPSKKNSKGWEKEEIISIPNEHYFYPNFIMKKFYYYKLINIINLTTLIQVKL